MSPLDKCLGNPSDSTISGLQLVKQLERFGNVKTVTVIIPLKNDVLIKLNDGSKLKGTLDSVSDRECAITLLKQPDKSVSIAYNEMVAIQKYKGFAASEVYGPTVMVLGDMLAIWGPGASIQLVRDGWAEYTVITIPATALGVGMGFGGRYLKGRRYRLKKKWAIRPL